ncbi:DUF6261 family protein [Capnocytophaga catalasegens]|uniref:Hemagglutinin n=1 Tax=Capnocytophaga catalasegens TaxID=1004260 RepID=A0AAV5AUK6_9FLAO|nr:DUF6261 family protein [Capnocytophaga catalasegens]GIZ16477.1 hypothetical protein RCZ03_24770 [Capnocytophaga catalasegens]GJM50284.1 hypothetical protein RCZ15_12570 [Capnocytophaga catalasegens]GJM53801.1 hypothetical protein RCZ16_21170 [Capnocytophaga catalasegens]
MGAIVKIKALSLSKLNNAEYGQFMTGVEKLVQEATLENIKVSEELFDKFKANVERLVEWNYQARTGKETKNLSEIDKERNQLLVYLFSVIRTAKKALSKQAKTAGDALYEVVKPLSGASKLPNQQKTLAIKALVNDFSKSENTSFVKTLGLSDTISSLESVNKKYETIVGERTASKALNSTTSVYSIRKETDILYDEITQRAYAESVSNPSNEVNTFVKVVNRLIEDTNTAFKLRSRKTPSVENVAKDKEF